MFHYRNQNPAEGATSNEREFREEQGYPQVEKHFSGHIRSRSDIPLYDRITSLLGTRNPVATEINPSTSSVWLLDNTAFRDTDPFAKSPRPWVAEFVAAYFIRDTGKEVSKCVGEIADRIGLGDGDGLNREEGEKIIAERFQPFVTTIQPARWVNVKFPSGELLKLGPGGPDGISTQVLKIPEQKHGDGDIVQINTIPAEVAPLGHMVTHFAEPEGWLFISGTLSTFSSLSIHQYIRSAKTHIFHLDIDDSIKITLTASPIGILRSTFVDTPTPITGMPDLYAHIAQLFNPTWFYLSASPYNLYTFLRPFLHQHYPHGTVILRDASWMDFAGFLRSYTVNTGSYKESRMDKIHSWLPMRKVLCLGDSTQSDPEAYGEIYRRYKGWVQRIFIRRVTGVSEFEEKQKNSQERFEKAFKNVPPCVKGEDGVWKGVWKVFDDPKELYEAVDALKE
jgi:Uncharacterized conserved protein (DUF2183)